MAERPVAGHLGVDDAGDELRLDELRPLLGLQAGGERARGTRQRLQEALYALELGLVEARARLAGEDELAVVVEAERERAEPARAAPPPRPPPADDDLGRTHVLDLHPPRRAAARDVGAVQP